MAGVMGLNRRNLLIHDQHPPLYAQPEQITPMGSDQLFFTAMQTWGLSTNSKQELDHLRRELGLLHRVSDLLGEEAQRLIQAPLHLSPCVRDHPLVVLNELLHKALALRDVKVLHPRREIRRGALV